MERIPRRAYNAVIYDDVEEFLRHPKVYSRYEFISHVINYGTPEMLRIIRESGSLPYVPLLSIQAAGKGDVLKMREFILAGYRPGTEELIEAAKQGNTTMVKYLLHFVREGLSEALSTAVYWGHLSTVKTLLDAGASIGERDLTNAYRGTYPDIVEYLISMGADPSKVSIQDRMRYPENPNIRRIRSYIGGVIGRLVSNYY
jgi:hypothetical protein